MRLERADLGEKSLRYMAKTLESQEGYRKILEEMQQ